MITRTYSELITFDSFEDRFNYLKLDGTVGDQTFGFDRYLNQILYRSPEWKDIRRVVILRDNGCDLAMDGHDILDSRRVIIHHMNPITPEMIERRDKMIFDPEFLITTILRTHNAIHYGDSDLLIDKPIVRSKDDTCLWR